MIKLKKEILTVDINQGNNKVVKFPSRTTDKFILSCITKEDMIFLTENEALEAISKISRELKEEFFTVYSKRLEVYDCIVNGLVNDSVFYTLKAIGIKADKYFNAYENFLCEALVKSYKSRYVFIPSVSK